MDVATKENLPLIPGEDKEWTREETDYLFDLVRQYDARFYVVADRYEYSGGSTRTMEVRDWPFRH